MGPTGSPVKVWGTAAIVTVLILTGVAAGLIPRWRQQTELAAETQTLSIPVVAVVSPKPGQSTSGMPLPADVKPWIEASIYARANGYLKRRLVDIGAHVHAGQLLADIETPELDQDLERTKGQLAQSEALLGLAEITAARWADLVTTASVSEQENAEKQADLRVKTANVESARAEVRRLERLKSFAQIKAPFAGIITVRNIDEGDLIVAAAGKELFHLSQTQRLRVYVQVPQEMARSIRPGQTAEMTIPELAGQVFRPTVVRTAGVVASDSRTLLVELELDNPKEEVLAGCYAQVRFTQAKTAPTLTLPANTILFRPEGPQVGIVQPDGKVELRSVKLGRDFGQTIEILSGVSSQDRVIANPADSLMSGAIVSISQTTKTEKSQ